MANHYPFDDTDLALAAAARRREPVLALCGQTVPYEAALLLRPLTCPHCAARLRALLADLNRDLADDIYNKYPQWRDAARSAIARLELTLLPVFKLEGV